VDEKPIGLYELVKGIREDFKKVSNDAEIRDNPLFLVKTVEIELAVEITNATEGGLKFWVLTGNHKRERGKLTSIKLQLEPFEETGSEKEVNSRSSSGGGSGGFRFHKGMCLEPVR
jgi:hypothetical protein